MWAKQQPKYVTEGDKRRALGAKLDRNADSGGRPQNTYKLGKNTVNCLGPSGTHTVAWNIQIQIFLKCKLWD